MISWLYNTPYFEVDNTTSTWRASYIFISTCTWNWRNVGGSTHVDREQPVIISNSTTIHPLVHDTAVYIQFTVLSTAHSGSGYGGVYLTLLALVYLFHLLDHDWNNKQHQWCGEAEVGWQTCCALRLMEILDKAVLRDSSRYSSSSMVLLFFYYYCTAVVSYAHKRRTQPTTTKNSLRTMMTPAVSAVVMV